MNPTDEIASLLERAKLLLGKAETLAKTPPHPAKIHDAELLRQHLYQVQQMITLGQALNAQELYPSFYWLEGEVVPVSKIAMTSDHAMGLGNTGIMVPIRPATVAEWNRQCSERMATAKLTPRPVAQRHGGLSIE